MAQSCGRRYVEQGDEIVITWLEHHANIVPWQHASAEKGAKLRVAPVDDRGQIILDEYEKLLNPRTRLVVDHARLQRARHGHPVREMVAIAHRHGARVLVDGAQAVSHMRVDVQALDCDFYVFSGHKVFGHRHRRGLRQGRRARNDAALARRRQHDRRRDVREDDLSAPADALQAGTGNIADAVGLGAALDYLERVGLAERRAHEHDSSLYATDSCCDASRAAAHRHRARRRRACSRSCSTASAFGRRGAALDQEGIAVRAGHHCAQPVCGGSASRAVRPSLALYNTCEDIDALVDALTALARRR